MQSATQDRKVQKLLFDAAVEIARLDGTENGVFRSLMTELQQQSQPLSTSVGEIAKLYDIAAADALDEVIRSGCRVYWWNGRPYEAEGIRTVIRDSWQWDVTGEIEVDLTPDQRLHLDQSLGEGDQQLAELESVGSTAGTQKPFRKFVGSQQELPVREGAWRSEKLG